MNDMALDVSITPSRERHSPCINICQLDAVKGLCIGCGRTGAEIASWPGLNDEERLDIYARLPERMGEINAEIRLLPWSPDDILAFVQETVRSNRGVWAVGDSSNAGLVRADALAEGRVQRTSNSVIAEAETARLQIDAHDKLRAFAVQENGRDGAIVLGLPRRRAEGILARRSAPQRDWLLPPSEVEASPQSGCCGGGCACACQAAATDPAERVTFETALARLAVVETAQAEAQSLLVRAAALPNYAVVMAVYDPSG